MKTGEVLSDLLRLTQVRHRVRDGIVIFQAEERRQFQRIQLLDTFGDSVREDEIEEGLWFGVEV